MASLADIPPDADGVPFDKWERDELVRNAPQIRRERLKRESAEEVKPERKKKPVKRMRKH